MTEDSLAAQDAEGTWAQVRDEGWHTHADGSLVRGDDSASNDLEVRRGQRMRG